MAAPVKLVWKVDPAIDKLINNASRVATALIKDTASITLFFEIYGSRYIKEVAKTSPDSFIQLLLQLAWKRMHGHPTAVYESASTRAFLHGRTETGRSLSLESLAFVDAFDNEDVLVFSILITVRRQEKTFC